MGLKTLNIHRVYNLLFIAYIKFLKYFVIIFVILSQIYVCIMKGGVWAMPPSSYLQGIQIDENDIFL